MQEEVDNDVEMNGAAQNGSHSGTGETPVDPGTKDDSFLEMGIHDCKILLLKIQKCYCS